MWTPPGREARHYAALAVIHHGYGSSGTAPNSVLYMAELLLSRGIVCYSMDMPGHGAPSRGLRFHHASSRSSLAPGIPMPSCPSQ